MRITRTILATALFAGAVAGSAPASAEEPFPATGLYNGLPAVAVQVDNVTVEGLPGARIVGRISNFVTTNPDFLCLNGSTLNVWQADAYGSQKVIHNGWQGPQCTYGTWIILAP